MKKISILNVVYFIQDIVSSRKDQITESEFKTALNKLVGHKVGIYSQGFKAMTRDFVKLSLS